MLYLDYQWEENGKWYYDLAVRYPDKKGTRQPLSKLKNDGGTAWAHNPWAGAMAQLGGFGWELVSVQHGTSATGILD